MSQPEEDWTGDLLRAGWREVSLHTWEAPDGRLFRGPFGAWYRMQQERRTADFMARHAVKRQCEAKKV